MKWKEGGEGPRNREFLLTASHYNDESTETEEKAAAQISPRDNLLR